MKSFYTIVFLFLVIFLSAQDFEISNQVTFGGDNKEFCGAILYTSDECILTAGPSSSGATGDKTDANFGVLFDYLIVKYDADYNLLWQKTIGGNENDYLTEIIELSDGNFLIAGYSRSDISGTKTSSKIGVYDYWLVKIDLNGEVLWEKSYGGESYNELEDIEELSNGDLVLSGSSNSDISGNKSDSCRGIMDYWIVKTDSDGNQLWDKTYGSEFSEFQSKILFDGEGNIYIYGTTLGGISGDKTEDSYGSYDVWVVKLNPEGDKIWDKTIGSLEIEDNVTAIYFQNYLYLAINSYGGIGGLKTEDIIGQCDVWLVKMDLDANIIWDKTIGGELEERVSDLVIYNDNSLLMLMGSQSGIGPFKSEERIGYMDNWIVNIDTDGQILWDKTIGALYSDQGPKCAVVDQSQIIVGCGSDSEIGGHKTDYCRGDFDMWIYTLDIPQRINSVENANFNFYPNPAKDFIQFDIDEIGASPIEIVDITGKVVKRIEAKQSQNRIDITSLQAGVYLVKLGNYTSKLIKE